MLNQIGITSLLKSIPQSIYLFIFNRAACLRQQYCSIIAIIVNKAINNGLPDV